jgi:hypothetical protein
MVAALDQGVFKTNDGGASWQPMRIQTEWWNDKWQNHDGSVVKAHPKKPQTWFAIIHGHGGTRHPRLHRTDDGGATWSLVLDLKEKFGGEWGKWLDDSEMGDLCFDPTNPDIMHLVELPARRFQKRGRRHELDAHAENQERPLACYQSQRPAHLSAMPQAQRPLCQS